MFRVNGRSPYSCLLFPNKCHNKVLVLQNNLTCIGVKLENKTFCNNSFENVAIQTSLNLQIHEITVIFAQPLFLNCHRSTYRGADKSLSRPGRKQATATKLWLLQATQKKKFRSLSVQPGLRGSNDLRVGRKMAKFQFFFCLVGLRTYQHPCSIYQFGCNPC